MSGKLKYAEKRKLMHENDISYKIIGAAIEIHKNIGPGLLESAYEHALAFDLREKYNSRFQCLLFIKILSRR